MISSLFQDHKSYCECPRDRSHMSKVQGTKFLPLKKKKIFKSTALPVTAGMHVGH